MPVAEGIIGACAIKALLGPGERKLVLMPAAYSAYHLLFRCLFDMFVHLFL